MAQIIVKRDPTIKLPKIISQLHSTDLDEVNDPENMGYMVQSKMTGIIYPLIAINGVAVDYNDLEYVELNCLKSVPVLGFVFQDRMNRFSQLAAPGTSHDVQLQILPRFDNAYKKINMLFYLDNIDIKNGKITGVAIYKCNDLIKSQFKCLGNISTYELFDKISTETGLGFASNIDNTEDKRLIYCDHKSYLQILQNEIKISLADEVHVHDWWIDLWNNLILCDIYDRYNSEDDMAENKIWISENDITGSLYDNFSPVEVEPVFSNHYSASGTSLYISNYKIITNTSDYFFKGNQMVLTTYSEQTKTYKDHIIGDGDIKKDDITKYEYLGEYYGEYDYLLADKCRNMYMSKMQSEIIEVELSRPLLGIMKGEQIRIVWYDNDYQNSINMQALDKSGLVSMDQFDLGWLKEYDLGRSGDINTPMVLNLQISGQYTVIGIFLTYTEGIWKYKLRLTRPASKKIQILPQDDGNN